MVYNSGSKVWKFVNKTTGFEMETNDLNFMKFDLQNNKGLQIPETEFVNLLLKGKMECVVLDEDNESIEISIEERIA